MCVNSRSNYAMLHCGHIWANHHWIPLPYLDSHLMERAVIVKVAKSACGAGEKCGQLDLDLFVYRMEFDKTRRL